FYGFALVAKIFCLAALRRHYWQAHTFATLSGFGFGLVPLATQQSVIYTFCMVQWRCHRENGCTR
ncbi:TPA: hypothetical protein ACJJYP_004365, partial [Enterobacter hormaechei subsp. xiangfangensis]